MRSAILRLTAIILIPVFTLTSQGCATLTMEGDLEAGDAQIKNDFFNKPILSDEIVAIGRPDAEMSRQLHNDHIVAFIGLKNTYLLFQGGEELERISRLNVDKIRIAVDAGANCCLYMKDRQVWGVIALTYGNDGKPVTDQEELELERGGFNKTEGNGGIFYQTEVKVEGGVYPALHVPDAASSRLSTHRTINFFNSKDSKPPKNTGWLMLPIAIGIDVVLLPVYLGLVPVGLVFKLRHNCVFC